MILCIESATGVCSVALCDQSGTIAIKESSDERAHSKLLATFVNDILNDAGTRASKLDAVVVSRGPGSYTGLRIGVSLAKGLAYGGGVPLIAVDTLLSMYHTLIEKHTEYAAVVATTHFCPMIDARRMEVYYSVIGSSGDVVSEAAAAVIDRDSFAALLSRGEVIFFGNGASKCREVLDHPNARFVDGLHPSANGMRIPALEALAEKRFADVAYFEPYYLKDFLATIPKKMVL
jgi:tRNA threonylcarbamoyladenosine biosynthesis protein TsaB